VYRAVHRNLRRHRVRDAGLHGQPAFRQYDLGPVGPTVVLPCSIGNDPLAWSSRLAAGPAWTWSGWPIC
jgi:hypothetical protein